LTAPAIDQRSRRPGRSGYPQAADRGIGRTAMRGAACRTPACGRVVAGEVMDGDEGDRLPRVRFAARPGTLLVLELRSPARRGRERCAIVRPSGARAATGGRARTDRPTGAGG